MVRNKQEESYQIMVFNNKISMQCLTCLEEITSLSRHDLVSCWCGDCFIDGGSDYVRAGSETGNYLMFTSTWTAMVYARGHTIERTGYRKYNRKHLG